MKNVPTYYDCAAAGNVMTDLCVSNLCVMGCGDLIRIVGHVKMDLLPETAAKMALDILDRCRALGWTDRQEVSDDA